MGSDHHEPWIRRPTPASPPDLEGFTGERYLTGIGGEIEAEHLHRYLFAAHLCAGKRVLDIASGEGYGSAILARVAEHVLGVDRDEGAITHARAAYPDADFEQGTCEDIPAQRDSFDVVVSFETLEHIAEQDRFLREVRRVLRPGGLLICSTPDARIYRHPEGENPYHTKELSREAFETLMSDRFEHAAFFGQRLANGSVIARGGSGRTRLISTRDARSFEDSPVDEDAVYLIAVCSDARLPKIGNSVYSDARYTMGTQDNLSRQLGAARQEIESLSQTRSLLEQSDASLTDIKTRLRSLEGENARLTEDRGRLLAERAAAEHERDGAIRDAAAAHVDYERAAGELERVREEMIVAREKAAAAQANEAASRAERETLLASTAKAIQAREETRESLRAAEIALARAEEQTKHHRLDADRAQRDARSARLELERMRSSVAWRWSAPARLASSAGRAGIIRSLGLGSRVLARMRLPGADRLRVARRAMLIRASELFDPSYYLERNPDVRSARVDPAWHYAARGWIEQRDPGPGFSTRGYLHAYPDVADAGVHPLEHYIMTGVHEGRSPMPTESDARPERVDQTSTKAPAPAAIEIKHASEPNGIPIVSTDAGQLARTRAIAFYLPQFHPIPENDAWWGRGFTEWTNVTRGRAMFPGQAQPMLPGDLGFYDLRLPEVRERQAELAKQAGIHGFCYYHYWFNGRRVLEHPLDEVLRHGEPALPFCICWANENWTRRWDGLEQEILLRQQHSLASDRAFMLDLLPYLEDDRYIRVDGRPVVLVYRADLMVDARDTAAVWRDECRRAGIGEIHLCAVQFRTGDPRPLGFDAAVEFPPHHFPAPEITGRVEGLDPGFGGTVYDYAAGARELIRRPRRADYRLYRGVMPSWDNTARRMEQAIIHKGSSPEMYEAWLRSAINQPQPDDGISDNLVFINAWNEWAEGTVLEPRRDLGSAYLDATARALGVASEQTQPIVVSTPTNNTTASSPPVPTAPTPAGSTIETKVKRLVRSSPALNSFVNRHPELKSRAAAALRRTSERRSNHSEKQPSNQPAEVSIRWRGRARNAGGPRLLVVSHDAALAGAQLIVLENLRHWMTLGYDCRALLLGSGPLESDFIDLCPTACAEGLSDRSAWLDRAITQLGASGWTPDAAFCNTVASVDAIDACRAHGIGVVASVYELPTSIEDGLGGRRTIDRVMRGAERVIVASRFVRDQLADAYTIDPDRLEPLHTGVLARPFPDRDEARAEIRRQLGVAPDAFVVLGCGSIHHRKGTDLFVRAAAETLGKAPGREIVFVWAGADQSGRTFGNWCRHDAERLGIAHAVRFIGEQHEPSRWFAGSDAFALTSREDPFPMVNLEALSYGLGIVAFEGAGGAPEALVDPDPVGDRGVVVPYTDTLAMGEALARFANDPAHLDTMRGRAMLYATNRLGWTQYMDAIRPMLESCSPAFALAESKTGMHAGTGTHAGTGAGA